MAPLFLPLHAFRGGCGPEAGLLCDLGPVAASLGSFCPLREGGRRLCLLPWGGGSSPVGSSSAPPTHRDPGAQGQETLYSCIPVPLLVLLTWGHPTSPRHAGPCLWVCMRGDMGTRVTVYVQVRASEKSFTET